MSFNTTSSFITNTNWQYYGGETTLSDFSQMAGLTVQNFVSAAVGMAVVAALIRGIINRTSSSLGNFWQDIVRTLFYVLLPLSIIVAVLLVSGGVLQTIGHDVTATTVEGADQLLAVGPVASQVAIKQLGTNGGGFFNVNSAMPFENATAFTNFVELLSIILIPAALTYTFGRMVGRQRQGWAIFAAMLALFLVFIVVIVPAEQHGTVAQHIAGLHTTPSLTAATSRARRSATASRSPALWTATTTSDLERLGQLRPGLATPAWAARCRWPRWRRAR